MPNDRSGAGLINAMQDAVDQDPQGAASEAGPARGRSARAFESPARYFRVVVAVCCYLRHLAQSCTTQDRVLGQGHLVVPSDLRVLFPTDGKSGDSRTETERLG